MIGSGTWNLATSHSEFTELRADWDRLFAENARHSPFVSWGWVDAWLRHIARDHELQIISWADGNGVVQFILPLHRVARRPALRAKKLMLVCNYGLECSDNLGCLRSAEYEDQSPELVAEGIEHFFGRHESVSLGFLDGNDDFPRRLEHVLAARGRLARVRPDAVCPAMDLPPDWDEYLGELSYKFRAQVRRSCRQITGDDPPQHRRVDADDVDAFTNNLIRLNRTRMSSKGNTSSLEDTALREFFTEAIPYMVSSDLAWMDTIVGDDEVLGAALHFVHGRTVYYYMGGFDDRIRKLQPGTGLLGQVIQRAIGHGLTRYDHLRGDEAYKYRWGAQNVFTSNVTIYPRGAVRGRLAELLDDLYLSARNTLKNIKNKLDRRR
jgi:CelD/BcsL family acetyltransferase involved in cellulose biosynthesis